MNDPPPSPAVSSGQFIKALDRLGFVFCGAAGALYWIAFSYGVGQQLGWAANLFGLGMSICWTVSRSGKRLRGIDTPN
jgi:hypothetical protein